MRGHFGRTGKDLKELFFLEGIFSLGGNGALIK